MNLELRYGANATAQFKAHRTAWKEGKIKLWDFCETYLDNPDGTRQPMWYGGAHREDGTSPIGHRVLIDKAQFFARVDYRPSYPQCLFHSSTARMRVFSGGARGGKSFAVGLEACPILLTPGTQTWIVGPEYDQCVKEFEYILTHTVEHPEIAKRYGLPRAAAVRHGGRVINQPTRGDMEIRLDWGELGVSWVRVKSAKMKDSLLSEELDALILVEAPLIAQDRWDNKLRMRLTTRSGLMWTGSTPAGAGDWFTGIYESGLESETRHGRIYTVTCDSRMNPTLSDAEVKIMTEDLNDADFAEQVLGRPTPRHGLVFPGFDNTVHVESWRHDWPKPSWKRFRAVDFGYQDPFCVLWLAVDEDWRFYVYREYYRNHVLPNEVLRHIADVEGWDTTVENDNVVLIGTPKHDRIEGNLAICDWDAAGRASLARGGLRIKRAVKDIRDGITSVEAAIRVRGDGKPGLYIHRSCVNTRREMGRYQWLKDSGNMPKQVEDHGMDTLRYGIHTTRPRGRRIIAAATGS